MKNRTLKKKYTVLLWTTILLSMPWAALAFAVLTPEGSRLALDRVLPAILPGKLAAARQEGSVGKGLIWRDAELTGLPKLPAGTRIRFLQARFDPARFLKFQRGAFLIRRARVLVPGWPAEIAADRIEIDLRGAVHLFDVEAARLKGMPAGAHLKIQRVLGSWKNFRSAEVQNGRLKLPNSEPILLYGRVNGGELDAHVFCRTLDVPDIVRPLAIRSLQITKGIFNHVDLRITGPIQSPRIRGRLRVDWLRHDTMFLGNGRASLDLRIRKAEPRTQMYGIVMIHSGRLALKNIVMDLEPSRLIYQGEADMPWLRIKGVSRIKDTKINILMEGTKDQPDVKLTSDPPLPEEALAIMLVTGRSWSGTEKALTEGAMSADAAKEFIDYFVFGGNGTRLAEQLGISDVSLQYSQESRGIAVKKALTDRMDLIYGVSQQSIEEAPIGDMPVSHKIGAEYQLTGVSSVALEGERELRSRGPGAAGIPLAAESAEPRETNEKVLLKYNQRF